MMMPWFEAGALLIGLVILFMGLTLPVAFAFMMVNMIGVIVFIGGDAGITQLVANSAISVTNFALVPVPLFILMGELFFHSGIAVKVFDVFDRLLGRIPGRLAYLTVGGGTVFAALSGSSMANTALLGSTMLPEMVKRGYKPHVSMGPIIGTGGLAILIPPSGLAVLLGSLASIDIGRLLIAGIIPGLGLAVLYVLVIAVSTVLDPKAAPHYPVEDTPWLMKLRLVVTNLLPMGFVIFMVVGLIIIGIATPTEAAAFGVLGVLIVAAGFRSLNRAIIWKSLLGTVKVTGMVFLIILGSSTFSQMLALSGASSGMISWATTLDVSPLMILAVMFVILLVMGMLMESVSIMMLTVPLFFPLAQNMGFDLIWFGVLVMVSLEIGLATPPFGMGLFVMLGVNPSSDLIEVSLATLPYVGCAILLVILLVIWPDIALFLPNLMD
jgi:tripartite ATP-independent transporter DctM subunit